MKDIYKVIDNMCEKCKSKKWYCWFIACDDLSEKLSELDIKLKKR